MTVVALNIIRTALRILKSKPLFRNYYDSIIRYALFKYGLISNGDINIKCFDGSETQVDPQTFSSFIHSYLDGVISGIDCSGNALRTINGFLVPIDEFMLSSAVGIALRSGWAYDINNRYWFRDGVKFRHMHWPIIENFDLGQYGFMSVEGKVILDIGAFVGDSAIYFVLKGAKLVYAVEPLPSNYEEMLQNIELNNMNKKIIPMKLAISYNERKVRMPYSTDAYLRGSSINEMMKAPRGSYEYIDAMPLRELYEVLTIKPEVLKLDCEGCEFDVILNDYEFVRKFSEVVLEYHSYITGRSVNELLSMLSRDFKCSFVSEEFYRRYFSDYSRDELGMIHCIGTT